MKSLRFKTLTLLSDLEKSGAQFNFEKSKVLITGNDNSVGKSTLAKLLTWSLGAEPHFDPAWAALDCRAMLEVSVDEDSYTFHRYKNQISVTGPDQKSKLFPKISGEYSAFFQGLTKFGVLLPNRDTGVLEVPPPSFFLLPFYIDQTKSWANAWDAFDKLGQYSRWQSSIVKFHTGYISSEHFRIESEVAAETASAKEMEAQNRKIDEAFIVVNHYAVVETLASTADDFTEQIARLRAEAAELQNVEQTKFSSFRELESAKTSLTAQLHLIEQAIEELEADYQFSVEMVEGDGLECPLCGTVHNNSLVSRTNLLIDKQKTIELRDQVRAELATVDQRIGLETADLTAVRSQIDSLEKRVSGLRTDSTVGEALFTNIAMKTVHEKVSAVIDRNSAAASRHRENVKNQKKAQGKLLTKEEREALDTFFQQTIGGYFEKLVIRDVPLAGVDTPLDYNRIFGSGGAADGARAILAYYLSVFRMILRAKQELVFPLIIDTPNQQEQSDKNYDKIVKYLDAEIASKTQVVMCAMENQHLADYKKDCTTILLKKGKLLDKKRYSQLEPLFEGFRQLLINETGENSSNI